MERIVRHTRFRPANAQFVVGDSDHAGASEPPLRALSEEAGARLGVGRHEVAVGLFDDSSVAPVSLTVSLEPALPPPLGGVWETVATADLAIPSGTIWIRDVTLDSPELIVSATPGRWALRVHGRWIPAASNDDRDLQGFHVQLWRIG